MTFFKINSKTSQADQNQGLFPVYYCFYKNQGLTKPGSLFFKFKDVFRFQRIVGTSFVGSLSISLVSFVNFSSIFSVYIGTQLQENTVSSVRLSVLFRRLQYYTVIDETKLTNELYWFTFIVNRI